MLSLDHLRLSRLIELSGQHLVISEAAPLDGIGQIFRRVTQERTGGEDRKAKRICDSLEEGVSRSCAGEEERLVAGGECERLFLFSVEEVAWCWGRGIVRWLSELVKLTPLFMLLQRLDGVGVKGTGVNVWDVGEYGTEDEVMELVRVGMRSGAVGAVVVVVDGEESFSFSTMSREAPEECL